MIAVKPIRLCLQVVAVCAMTMAMSAQALVLSLTPASQNAAPGDTVFVDLVASGLGDGVAPSIGDFDLDVLFDPGALNFTGYSLGTSLGDLAAFEADDFSLGEWSSGLVGLSEVSYLLPFELDALQSDIVTLATLEFSVHTLAVGAVTDVAIDLIYAIGDGFGLGDQLQVDDTDFARIINPRQGNVPLPGTLLLLAAGFAALRSTRRR